jgi:outer membrane protein
MRRLRLPLLLSCLPLAPALAADPALTDPAPAKGWTVTLGASAVYGPDYDGAKGRGFSAMPSFSISRADRASRFSAPDDGMDFALYETERFSIGVVGDYKAGRYTKHDRRLVGLRDVPWSLEGGVFAEIWPVQDRLRARVELRKGLRGHHGVVADFSADWVETAGSFTFALGPRLMLGSASYMRSNYGVTTWESALNGLIPAYRPGGGMKSYGVAGSVEYAWNESWSTTVFARYDRMAGDAARSPLVRQIGDRNQFSLGVSTSYSFDIGG